MTIEIEPQGKPKTIPHTCPEHPDVREWVLNKRTGIYKCPEYHGPPNLKLNADRPPGRARRIDS